MNNVAADRRQVELSTPLHTGVAPVIRRSELVASEFAPASLGLVRRRRLDVDFIDFIQIVTFGGLKRSAFQFDGC